MNPSRTPLPQSFYDHDVTAVARRLIGMYLVREVGVEDPEFEERGSRPSHSVVAVLMGRIVEVEAYLSADDPASHSHRGPTRRNASMFGPPGIAYVYQIHTHHCVNVVAEGEGRGAAVLIRALEPLAGEDEMRVRRGREDRKTWTSGPGKLCQALAIDRSLDGWDLTSGQQLWIEEGEAANELEIVCSPRIGIRLAPHLPLRFFVRGNPYVSRLR